jgi:transposase
LLTKVLAGLEATAGRRLVGDKGYNSGRLRAWCEAHGLIAVIPRYRHERVQEVFDRGRYRDRNVVERLFNRLKHYRRIATRYEKRADMYLAMLSLVAVLCWI